MYENPKRNSKIEKHWLMKQAHHTSVTKKKVQISGQCLLLCKYIPLDELVAITVGCVVEVVKSLIPVLGKNHLKYQTNSWGP